jgi:hypothetical protein
MSNGWHLTVTGPARKQPVASTWAGYQLASTWAGYQLHCAYCTQAFATRRSNVETCSPECAARHAAWNRWIRVTRQAAIYGRGGPAHPAAGASLTAAVSRYAVQLELKEVPA